MSAPWRRRAYIGVTLVTLGALTAACGGSDSGSGGGGGGGGGRTAAVIKGLDNPFFQQMRQGIEDQAKAQDTSVTVQAANSITDTTGQADKLNGMGQQDYACYLVNPISGSNLVQSLAQISRKDKPIVNIDSPVDPDAAERAGVKIATYAGTENVNAGKMAGQEMLKQVPGGSRVARIGGTAGDVTSQDRLTGFAQEVGSKLQVAAPIAANWDRQKALTAAQDILRGQPNTRAFFVANDDMALGVTRAIANAGKTGQVKVVSVDGIKDALNAIKSGELAASVAQYPYAIGQMGMEACKAAADGKTLPARVAAPVAVVTKSNADQALGSFPKPFQQFNDPYKSL